LLRIGADDLRRVGLSEPARLIVPANTLIVADVFGFHGRTPRRSATIRVAIFGSLRGNPFIPWEWMSQSNFRRVFANERDRRGPAQSAECGKNRRPSATLAEAESQS
jgi:hypothetical protein